MAAVAITLTLVYSGTMLRYDPGVMQQATWNQSQVYNHFDLIEGEPLQNYVAVLHCRFLGLPVWIRWPDGRLTKHYVGDCCNPKHIKRRRELNRPVEVSHSTAAEYCAGRSPCAPVDDVLPGVQVYMRRPRGSRHHRR